MEENVTIGKDVIWFAVINLALTVCFSIVLILLEIDSNTSAIIASLVGAAMIAGSKFIQDHKRVPNRSEKTKLVWLSYLTSWLVSLLLLSGFILATLSLSYGFLARKQLDDMKRKGVI
ncbi:MAG: ABZJ_00895 family protein [Candidatus Thiodiazotropha sp. (ex. Lucinisca nassula)]|nr:ABZJ_00895 family protein [Candidatus Thiodiazotropha sp. (ex. Lucinisca nassula)]